MSITQFMVPKAGKGAAGAKRQLAAGDGAQPEAPAAKVSRQGRTWIDWQRPNCTGRGCAGPWSLATPELTVHFKHSTVEPSKPVQVRADSLLTDLLSEDSWRDLMNAESKKPYFSQLESFVKLQLDSKTVYPPRQHIFRALNELPVGKVKAVIIGQVCHAPTSCPRKRAHSARSQLCCPNSSMK